MKKKSTARRKNEIAKDRVGLIRDYYDQQTDEQSAREITSAPRIEMSWIEVPSDLVKTLRKFIREQRKTA